MQFTNNLGMGNLTSAELLARRERLLGTGITTFYQDPVHIVRGEGDWLYDADGRHYLEVYNNVPCVGRANPHVVEAMQHRTETLNVHSRYLHKGSLGYTERLTSLHAAPITTAVFTCGGTEANKVAIQMARAATGGRDLICIEAAYHGNSTEVRKLTRLRGRKFPEIRSIPVSQRFQPIGENCEPIADVRGRGLFVGIEWVKDRRSMDPDPDGAEVIMNRLRKAGFLMGRAGQYGNVLKVRPPLVFNREHADLFLEGFAGVVSLPA